MKAISFFCIVFVSMLSAFLIATGEVRRWFAGGDERTQLVFNTPPATSTPAANMLYFPFYNVELGKLSFTIRAELSQDDLEVKDKFDEIRHLTLRNGSLDIPVYDGLVLGATPESTKEDAAGQAEGEEHADASQQITLTFETAEWQRPPEPSGHNGMKVALTNGRGTTNDGFSFQFEQLLFQYSSGKGEDSYEVSSDHPVSIRNQAFELHSPRGLRGKLRGIGLESLTFLPPVTAVIDRKRAPFFQYVTRSDTLAERGTGDESAGGESAATEKQGGDRVVITSQGELELHSLQPEDHESRLTVIAFNKDVVIRPQRDESHAQQTQSRFECQYLELAFREVERRLAPQRALATWDGGRVKAVFQKTDGNGDDYIIDGKRLEWTYHAPPENPDGDVGAQSTSQAILYGNPTLTGRGSSFQARRALLDLPEGRVLLDEVDGRFRIRRRASKRAGGDSGERGLDQLGGDPRQERKEEASTLPENWTMKADTVEFFFADSGSDARKLSHFTASSRRPGEVVVESSPIARESSAEAPSSEDQVRLTASRMTYQSDEKMITFAGTPEVKPDFSQGENRIESLRIRLLLEEDEELALFEGAVHARVVDTGLLAAATGAGGAPASTREHGNGDAREERHGQPDGPVELTAELLTAGLDEEGKSISFLRARGTDAAPARIVSTSGNHFVIEGAELEWNRRDETAIVWGTPPGPSERAGAPGQSPFEGRARPAAGPPEEALPAPPPLAHLEFEGGHLRAERISFDQKTRTAYLEKHVVLECAEGNTSVSVLTGRAEVEFFGDASEKATDRGGILRELHRIKAFQAHRAERSPIELIGEHFRAYADEAVWNAETSELRFFGSDKQKITIANEHFQGPIYAREVVYSVKDDLLTLRGEVEGQLTQQLSRSSPSGDGQPMEWRFETSRLELQLEPGDAGPPRLRSLHAREWVHLTSTKGDLVLRLLGDALDYDALSGKVVIFSPAGRPQTFFRVEPEPAQASASTADSQRPGVDPSVRKRDEIIAQRILLLPYPGARYGESRSWLNVVFEQNVKAVFRPPAESAARTSSRGKPSLPGSDPWELETEKLVLRVDPGEAPSAMVTWATAQQNVVFKSGVYTATGERAEYDDAAQTLVLTGTPDNPAQLSGEDQNGRPYKHRNERIEIRREGDRISIRLDSRRTNRR